MTTEYLTGIPTDGGLFPVIGTAKSGFLGTREAEGVKPHTLQGYRQALDQFFGLVFAANPAARLEDITSQDVEAYVIHLQSRTYRGKKLSRFTVANYFTVVRNFFNYCVEKGLLEKSPVRMKRPRTPIGEIEPLDREEIMQLLAATTRNPPIALRDQALILLLWNTGLRREEAAKLKVEHIMGDRILVKGGKGDKDRTLGIEESTRRVLMAHIGDRQGMVFDLTGSGIYRALFRLGQSVGIPNVRPHRLRHSFATHYLENGGDVFKLKYLMGHSGIQTTMAYVAYVNKQNAIDEQMLVSPMAKLAVA